MISAEAIEKSIIELEQRDTSFATCERLAWLYIVKDHLTAPSAPKMTSKTFDDDFCEACAGVPYEALMRILKDHMDCVRVLYPKEYDAVMSQIKELKRYENY